jgi:hypothetical protein
MREVEHLAAEKEIKRNDRNELVQGFVYRHLQYSQKMNIINRKIMIYFIITELFYRICDYNCYIEYILR